MTYCIVLESNDLKLQLPYFFMAWIYIVQVPDNKRYQPAVSCYSFGTRNRSSEARSKGRCEIEFQAVSACTKSRSM